MEAISRWNSNRFSCFGTLRGWKFLSTCNFTMVGMHCRKLQNIYKLIQNFLKIQANHWLIPIDIFGGWKKFKDKLEIFDLAPDGILVREKNELLNSSDCTQPTTTSKMTPMPNVTTTMATTQTTNSAISTPRTQTGANSTLTTTFQTESTSSAPPCDKKCYQLKIDAIESEIVKLEEFCKPEEFPVF